MKIKIITIVTLFFSTLPLNAQKQQTIIQEFLDKNYQEQGLTKNDVSQWKISSQHVSSTSGASHVYIYQTCKGIKIANGTANLVIKEGQVVNMGSRLISNIQQRITTITPKINSKEAIQKAATALQLPSPKNLKILSSSSPHHFIYNNGKISKEHIPVELVYYATERKRICLAWDLSIYQLNAQHWWSVKIDAQTGKLLHTKDWVVHCTFDHGGYKQQSHQHIPRYSHTTQQTKLHQSNQYTVFPLPLESPNHGNQSSINNPANSLASPYGWHDTNGVVGADYTITRGNNVFAYEDTDNDNLPGFSPDGGTSLLFNFPYSNNTAALSQVSASITNLFYINNMMHDIWYHHGFDEASGNFQANNYGRGGLSNDFVLVEAQDGGGMNNANFSTPSDGSTPRMQVYLWRTRDTASFNYFAINAPSNIARRYNAIPASIGPSLPSTPISADLVLLEDNTPNNDGCDPLTNATALAGKIAVVDRGNCPFTDKIIAAQDAGAVAVLVVNNRNTPISQMGGSNTTTITIPSLMISQTDGNTLKAQLRLGAVNASISNGGTTTLKKDGGFDNGIIAHEYGHGISSRLTGGASNSGCLFNDEQMGEGWSDWFALMLTMELGDRGTDTRGIGTYASNEPTTGGGIRPAPYSTDFAINGFTYGASNNTTQISKPHGIGFIFATVLWDLNWALIDYYGGTPDFDLYNGTGGNNIAMKLVIESLKLQPCSPGMVDGRNALLQADQLLYNGAHQCLIWKTFARRGLGYSANQGSPYDRTDQVEAFDLPPSCQIATQAPLAGFQLNTYNACTPQIAFTDTSTNIPQTWLWDFGDGNTSTVQNPIHRYSSSGTYTIRLYVSNNIGQDSISHNITITLPSAPMAEDVEACMGDAAYLTASGSGTMRWRNTNNDIIHLGDTLVILSSSTPDAYYVENVVEAPNAIHVGPLNGNIGTGGFLSSSFYGALNFTAYKSLEFASVWVNANGAGPRTFYIVRGHNTTGNFPASDSIVDQITLNLVNGSQRINLNLTVPTAGNYNIGVANADLFRNRAGANYPYTALGYLSILSSSSSSAPNDFYYYLYDLEIRDPSCISLQDTVILHPIISEFNFTSSHNSLTFTDASIGATSWYWDFGDGNTSTARNPIHTYNSIGTYNVSLTINNGACSSTQTIPINLIAVDKREQGKLSITLSPNPSHTQTTLHLGEPLKNELQIQLLDTNGKVCHKYRLAKGKTSLKIDTSNLPKAVYLLQLESKKFSSTQKLIVN